MEAKSHPPEAPAGVRLTAFPGGAFNPEGNTQGFDSPGDSEFVVFSLAHAYVLSNASLNQARIGFVRTANAVTLGDQNSPRQR